ncbi:MAG: biotin synthase BioB [Rhodospirillales bacterium]|nr:biotin synthase BioB [Alphaproteobacteria bacterium]MCB1840253.1 biotin synthase BioB [Alphaproteobacteria bacterium]MCB9977689.1 biotin synthase BioB [Rhodospirillales bacterium]
MTKQSLSLQDVEILYHKPLLDLVYEAAAVHRAHHDSRDMQLCTLLSIKTGGCAEDCKYCSQSIYNNTDLEKEILLKTDEVLESARKAKEAGSTRFCMGAAWPRVLDGRAFDRVLEMVSGVKAMDMEVCCTLGMLTEDQAQRLKDAGLTAYNHNLDTSEEFYENIITTRTYQDRLDTIENVAKAGISLCCGGILGMGESQEDRIALLHRLASLDPQPESVPINMLVPVAGTPLEGLEPLDIFEWIRCIAVARILMPQAMVRLSAGRLAISKEAQALAFLAGANAIFTGEKLLTTPNPGKDADTDLLAELGLQPRVPFKEDDSAQEAA